LDDGLNFDIFNAINIDVPIVFCTAFHEYEIRAFEVNSVDYLLKPIDGNKLRNSLENTSALKTLMIFVIVIIKPIYRKPETK